MIIVDDMFNGVVESFKNRKAAEHYIGTLLDANDTSHETDFKVYEGEELKLTVIRSKIKVTLTGKVSKE